MSFQGLSHADSIWPGGTFNQFYASSLDGVPPKTSLKNLVDHTYRRLEVNLSKIKTQGGFSLTLYV
jgi:hypothetical protein